MYMASKCLCVECEWNLTSSPGHYPFVLVRYRGEAIGLYLTKEEETKIWRAGKSEKVAVILIDLFFGGDASAVLATRLSMANVTEESGLVRFPRLYVKLITAVKYRMTVGIHKGTRRFWQDVRRESLEDIQLVLNYYKQNYNIYGDYVGSNTTDAWFGCYSELEE